MENSQVDNPGFPGCQQICFVIEHTFWQGGGGRQRAGTHDGAASGAGARSSSLGAVGGTGDQESRAPVGGGTRACRHGNRQPHPRVLVARPQHSR